MNRNYGHLCGWGDGKAGWERLSLAELLSISLFKSLSNHFKRLWFSKILVIKRTPYGFR